MGRRGRTSPAEDIVSVVSMLPWWAGLTIAVISYFALHAYAGQPVVMSTVPGQVASSMVPAVFKSLASVGQYILPLLFFVAAVISWFKRNKALAAQGSAPRVKAQPGQPAEQQGASCPICSGSMVLRAAKRGNNAGKSFWGCSNYPRCKGTRAAV